MEQCCTFRGSFSKLDVRSGFILWQTFMLPNNYGKIGEYAGAAIWGSSQERIQEFSLGWVGPCPPWSQGGSAPGSSPSIDISRNHVYIATGNLYLVPLNISQCQEKENNQTVPTHTDQCVEPDNHSDSFLALDLDSGKIKWYHQVGGYDVWFVACNNLSTPNCLPGPNPDADFGEAPMMVSINSNNTKLDIVVAVQKSGLAWALDRNNGNLIWSTEEAVGEQPLNNKRVYTNIINSGGKNFTLKPSNITTTASGWVAMNADNGKILWSSVNPSNATASGLVTLANHVLFAGSTHSKGPIYAMNAKTGEILWSYETGATVFGGMSVSDGCAYVGRVG
uniref:Pyrrolo-quinoline quinone repeat domain-containing protein n=1 Tax=Fagus sylvatica TaxID=28930 RepID=A0A2N9HKE3_FAGSY